MFDIEYYADREEAINELFALDRCPLCGGDGVVSVKEVVETPFGDFWEDLVETTCPRCEGEGELDPSDSESGSLDQAA